MFRETFPIGWVGPSSNTGNLNPSIANIFSTPLYRFGSATTLDIDFTYSGTGADGTSELEGTVQLEDVPARPAPAWAFQILPFIEEGESAFRNGELSQFSWWLDIDSDVSGGGVFNDGDLSLTRSMVRTADPGADPLPDDRFTLDIASTFLAAFLSPQGFGNAGPRGGESVEAKFSATRSVETTTEVSELGLSYVGEAPSATALLLPAVNAVREATRRNRNEAEEDVSFALDLETSTTSTDWTLEIDNGAQGDRVFFNYNYFDIALVGFEKSVSGVFSAEDPGPETVSLLLPAVQAAREAARREEVTDVEFSLGLAQAGKGLDTEITGTHTVVIDWDDSSDVSVIASFDLGGLPPGRQSEIAEKVVVAATNLAGAIDPGLVDEFEFLISVDERELVLDATVTLDDGSVVELPEARARPFEIEDLVIKLRDGDDTLDSSFTDLDFLL